jgi:tRNA1Val (adenine37-N6)-methyltransferase
MKSHISEMRGEAFEVFRFRDFQVFQRRDCFKITTDSVLLGVWSDFFGDNMVLDVGSGTGVVALIAASRNREALLTGIDKNPTAVELAGFNARYSPWPGRLRFYKIALADFQCEGAGYDHIVSNPPFHHGVTLSGRETDRFSRHSVGFTDETLLEATERCMQRNGKLSLILPPDRAGSFVQKALSRNLFTSRTTEVTSVAGKPVERVLLEFKYIPSGTTRTELVIRDINGQFTDQYRELMQDFYLHL